MDLSKITKAYIKIRDARTELKREYDEKDVKLKEDLLKLEGVLLNFLTTNKMDSIRTEVGTVFRQEEIKPSASDWSALYDWIKDNDAFEFLEKRVSRGAVREYMEMHEGGVPPGVSIYREYVVRVRRS